MSLKLKIILSIVGPVVIGLSGVVFYLSYIQYKPLIRHEIIQRVSYNVDNNLSMIDGLLRRDLRYADFLKIVKPMFGANKELLYVSVYSSQGPTNSKLYGVVTRNKIRYRSLLMSHDLESVVQQDNLRYAEVRTGVYLFSSVTSASDRESVTNLPIVRTLDIAGLAKKEIEIYAEATNRIDAMIQAVRREAAAGDRRFQPRVISPGLDPEAVDLVRGLIKRTNEFQSRLSAILPLISGSDILKRVSTAVYVTIKDCYTDMEGTFAPAVKGSARQDFYAWRLGLLARVKNDLVKIVNTLEYIDTGLMSKLSEFDEIAVTGAIRHTSKPVETFGQVRVIRLVKAVKSRDFPRAVVEVGISEDQIAARLEPIITKGLISASVFLVLSVLFGLLLSVYLIYPIDVLNKAAYELRRDRSVRIKMKRRDEFGNLAKAMNYLSDELTQELRKYESLYSEATEDELTKLMVRRYFMSTLQKEMANGSVEKRPTSLLMTDIDHFKIFNDTYGHLTGDVVLSGVAKILLANLRKSGIRQDVAGRYGGEEFCVLLPNTSKIDAVRIAERIRQQVEAMRSRSVDGKDLRITISIGVAVCEDSCLNPDDLIARADQNLYRSKESGRNRVTALD